ncbi:MAG: hypothetical protein EOQ42_28965 [Mesorhizobium sp.]|nr:MAG: hypothetical protein EOQ42_28965 [Mesorhizobium sp.]
MRRWSGCGLLPARRPIAHGCAVRTLGTQTFIAGLRCFGLAAPWIIDRPMNRAAFDTYIEAQLAATLSRGDVVVLENLATRAKEPPKSCMITAHGSFFLPPYSPDLNPSQRSRRTLRAAHARTFDTLTKALGSICDLFNRAECLDFFNAAGMRHINRTPLNSVPFAGCLHVPMPDNSLENKEDRSTNCSPPFSQFGSQGRRCRCWATLISNLLQAQRRKAAGFDSKISSWPVVPRP